jgi:hypothetical protein
MQLVREYAAVVARPSRSDLGKLGALLAKAQAKELSPIDQVDGLQLRLRDLIPSS